MEVKDLLRRLGTGEQITITNVTTQKEMLAILHKLRERLGEINKLEKYIPEDVFEGLMDTHIKGEFSEREKTLLVYSMRNFLEEQE